MAGIQGARDQGRVGHYPIGISAAGDFLVGTYQNEYADGTTVIAAGIARFGAAGKIVEMRSIEPADYVARMTGQTPSS